jgi:hypothetical protein
MNQSLKLSNGNNLYQVSSSDYDDDDEFPLKLKIKIGQNYEEYPSDEQIKNLPLQNIKFFSTHNSYIIGQYKGKVSSNYVRTCLGYLPKFPVCIEIDLKKIKKKKTRKKGTPNTTEKDSLSEFYVDHYSKGEKMTLEQALNEIQILLTEFSKKKISFFPLLISIDTTQIKSSLKKPKYKKKLMDIIKKALNNYLYSNICSFCGIEQNTSNILDVKLQQLIGKVLIRYKIENQKGVDFTNLPHIWFTETTFDGKNYKNSSIKSEDTNKIEECKYDDNHFLRVYPGGMKEIKKTAEVYTREKAKEIKKLTMKAVKKMSSLSLSSSSSESSSSSSSLESTKNTDSSLSSNNLESCIYLQEENGNQENITQILNKNPILQFIFGDNNINCVAFNLYELDDVIKCFILIKFSNLYAPCLQDERFLLSTQVPENIEDKKRKRQEKEVLIKKLFKEFIINIVSADITFSNETLDLSIEINYLLSNNLFTEFLLNNGKSHILVFCESLKNFIENKELNKIQKKLDSLKSIIKKGEQKTNSNTNTGTDVVKTIVTHYLNNLQRNLFNEGDVTRIKKFTTKLFSDPGTNIKKILISQVNLINEIINFREEICKPNEFLITNDNDNEKTTMLGGSKNKKTSYYKSKKNKYQKIPKFSKKRNMYKKKHNTKKSKLQ